MSISDQSFTQLMQDCGDFIDNQTIRIADLDLARIAVKAGDLKLSHKMIPPDRMIRYNFLEAFIRLSE